MTFMIFYYQLLSKFESRYCRILNISSLYYPNLLISGADLWISVCVLQKIEKWKKNSFILSQSNIELVYNNFRKYNLKMLFPAYSLDYCPIIPQDFFFQNMNSEYMKLLEQKQELE